MFSTSKPIIGYQQRQSIIPRKKNQEAYHMETYFENLSSSTKDLYKLCQAREEVRYSFSVGAIVIKDSLLHDNLCIFLRYLFYDVK